MIRHIVAIDRKRGIAKDGVQPWKLPSDEAYFGKLTKGFGGAVLMGRKTYDTIGHPLPDRQNFIVSRQAVAIPGCTVIADVVQFLHDRTEDLWIIGGAMIYELTLPFTDELYVTEIDADFDCDQFYPDYLNVFALRSDSERLEENGLGYKFRVYTKRS